MIQAKKSALFTNRHLFNHLASPIHNQTQLNEESILVLEPPRQEREDKRQAPSSSRPGGGPMTDPLHTLCNHPFWPSLSLLRTQFMLKLPTGRGEGKDEIKRAFKAEVCFNWIYSIFICTYKQTIPDDWHYIYLSIPTRQSSKTGLTNTISWENITIFWCSDFVWTHAMWFVQKCTIFR